MRVHPPAALAAACLLAACLARPAAAQEFMPLAAVPAGAMAIGDGLDHVKVDCEFPAFKMGVYLVTNRQCCAVYNWAWGRGRLVQRQGKVYVDPKWLAHFPRVLADFAVADAEIVVDARGFRVKPGRDDYPVAWVDWYGAALFCNFLSEMEGLRPAYDTVDWGILPDADGYRLPSDEQYEYAARGAGAGRGCRYAGSDDAEAAGWFLPWSGNVRHPVGRKLPNELGLYDLSGNLNEFCTETVAPMKSVTQQEGPRLVTGNRIWRGGAYNQTPVGVFFYRQNINNPDYALPFPDVGFRVVRP